MSDGSGRIGRRRMLAATAGLSALGGVAGCLSMLTGSDGYRVRLGEDADWQSLTPVETGNSHRDAYCGSETDSCETAQHGLDGSDAIVLFAHRDATDEDAEDALVVTYDTPDDAGGTATLTLDESIDPEADVIVADGPLENSGSTADTYEQDRFVHTWVDDYTDGAVVSLAALSEPTLEFTDTQGLDEVVVVSGTDPANVESYTADVGTPVSFEF